MASARAEPTRASLSCPPCMEGDADSALLLNADAPQVAAAVMAGGASKPRVLVKP